MPPSDPADRLLLVVRAQSGDRSALDQLLRRLQTPLYEHIRAIVRDDDLSKDVLQDALWIVARKLPSLRDGRWVRAWAYRIATREAIHRTRTERQWAEALSSEEMDQLPSLEREEVFDSDLSAVLPGLIGSLSPASQIVLRMHYLDELTHVEIAEALEIAVGTVKSRIAYGLRALRKELTPRRF